MIIKSITGLLLLASAAFWHQCATAHTPVTPNFFPLKEGSKWHYRLSVGEQSMKCTLHAAKVESVGGVDPFLMEMIVGGNVVSTEHLVGDHRGVFRHSFNGMVLEKPICIVRYPARAGDSWHDTIFEGGVEANLTTTIGMEEVVHVAAGKFMAIPVRLDLEMEDGATLTTTYWFAANVGIVKQTVEAADLQLTMELERFELVR